MSFALLNDSGSLHQYVFSTELALLMSSNYLNLVAPLLAAQRYYIVLFAERLHVNVSQFCPFSKRCRHGSSEAPGRFLSV